MSSFSLDQQAELHQLETLMLNSKILLYYTHVQTLVLVGRTDVEAPVVWPPAREDFGKSPKARPPSNHRPAE